MPHRDMRAGDLEALHRINQAGVPGVGSLSHAAFGRVLALGEVIVAVDALDAPLGFILLMAPGVDYKSANYGWFVARGADFIYVDRIAVAAEARGTGVGGALYQVAIDRWTGRARVMGCEVNRLPPNPGSMRFHERIGFMPIGERTYDAGEKAVVYLTLDLSPMAARPA